MEAKDHVLKQNKKLARWWCISIWWKWFDKLWSRKITITQKKKWKTFKMYPKKKKKSEDQEYCKHIEILTKLRWWLFVELLSMIEEIISIFVKKIQSFLMAVLLLIFFVGVFYTIHFHMTIYFVIMHFGIT